jgi:hypothetical protein
MFDGRPDLVVRMHCLNFLCNCFMFVAHVFFKFGTTRRLRKISLKVSCICGQTTPSLFINIEYCEHT